MTVIFTLIVSSNILVYADDELEDAVTEEEIEEILQTAADITDIPVINSRHAVIFDRTSRKSIIWKKRE